MTLERLELQVPEEMTAAVESVEPGDTGFCEAIAARAYFRALFGFDFSRESYDETNCAELLCRKALERNKRRGV